MMMLRAAPLLALLAYASAQAATFQCYEETAPTVSNNGNTVTWGKQQMAGGPFASCITVPVTAILADSSSTGAVLQANFGTGVATTCANTNLAAISKAVADGLNQEFAGAGIKATGTVGQPACCEANLCNTAVGGGGQAVKTNSGAAITVNALLMAALTAGTFLLTSKLV